MKSRAVSVKKRHYQGTGHLRDSHSRRRSSVAVNKLRDRLRIVLEVVFHSCAKQLNNCRLRGTRRDSVKSIHSRRKVGQPTLKIRGGTFSASRSTVSQSGVSCIVSRFGS